MNKGVFDKLSKPHQEALLRAQARNTSAKYRTEVRGFENTLFGMNEKAGGQTVNLTPEQRAHWRKVMLPVFPRIVEETGGSSKAFFAAMEAGREACTKK